MVRSAADRPDPAGAFPIAPTWPARRAVSGTYDEAWQRTRWPYFPEDFDWGYFNAAPRDQQIEGYWRGDEEIELTGLHPAEPLIRCRLPGVRPRVFLHHSGADAGLREVALNLDTITLDIDTLRVHVVWRGLAEIARETLEGIPTSSWCTSPRAPQPARRVRGLVSSGSAGRSRKRKVPLPPRRLPPRRRRAWLSRR